MIKLDLGIDFSEEHLNALERVVEFSERNNTDIRVGSVYGSPKHTNPFGSTRPLFRETEVRFEAFRKTAQTIRNMGIEVNLTFNSLFPHMRPSYNHNIFTSEGLTGLNNFVESVYDVVDVWIIAHPWLIEYFHNYSQELALSLSTIINIHTIPQIVWIKEHWPQVKRICSALWKNRDFGWLKTANEIIPLELLANEFCSIGGVECEGLYRQSCYLAQTMDVDWNPMKTCCIEQRRKHPEAWLMARFILPQWLEKYEEQTGVKWFKITGRTHPAEFVEFIGKTYTTGEYYGNLLSLWGQLEATLDKSNWSVEQQIATGRYIIPANKIKSMILAIGNCDPDECGIKCTYCKEVMENILKG